MHEIEHEEIVGREVLQSLIADLLEEAQKASVADVARQAQQYAMIVRGVRIRERLALAHTLAEHQIHALAGALDEAATRQRFGDPTIARLLPVAHIVGRDTFGESAGAFDFEQARVLPHPDRSGVTVVAVADGIEHSLANTVLVEGRNVVFEKALAELLHLIAQIYEFPQLVHPGKEAAPELYPLLVGKAVNAGVIFHRRAGAMTQWEANLLEKFKGQSRPVDTGESKNHMVGKMRHYGECSSRGCVCRGYEGRSARCGRSSRRRSTARPQKPSRRRG